MIAAWPSALPPLAAAPAESVDLDAPVIELVPPEGPALGLATVMALACDEDIREVGFWIDGDFVGADDSPPFEIEADFGAVFEPHKVRARAVDRHQVVVGETSIEVNTGEVGLLAALEHVNGQVRVSAHTPPNSPLPTVYRIYADETRLASQSGANLDLAVSTEQLNGADVLRVSAEYEDGSTIERYLPTRQGFVEVVDVNDVRLWVTVTDRKGRPVLDLPPDAFRLEGDGWTDASPQIIQAAEEPLSVGVILDGSDSMSSMRDALRESTETLVTELLSDRDRLLLFDVADRPRLLNPDGDPNTAVERLDEWVDGGGSALYDSLYFALRRLAVMEGRKALVLLSDGADLHSHMDNDRVTDAAWRAGIPVFLITGQLPHDGVSRLRAYHLRSFVRSTGGRTFSGLSSDRQKRAFATVLELMRRPYVLQLAGDGGGDLAQLREVTVQLPDPKMDARVFIGRDG